MKLPDSRSLQVDLYVDSFRGTLKMHCRLLQQTLTNYLYVEKQVHWLQMQQEPISLCCVVNYAIVTRLS